jgi:hypothetical protein
MALLAEAEALLGGFEPGNALLNGDAASASVVTVPVPLLWDSRTFACGWMNSQTLAAAWFDSQAISAGWMDSRAIALND